ncbi:MULTISPECIES: hypothetical protein [unclassified Pseudoalteromonas]|uniref:hypothetical protein n=1 Tax=unclassified Pseudoalteromonas TaxID=194690 RepID=UPI001109F8B9|nr:MULTISPECIES: hypothetical protein [unclassified Pseudoalteromonas]TMN84545.1 hypothetical protein CWB64_03930 [Pseudoalteromonas sp. S410]TMN91238.1 hypothetical protein CWB62_08060 [Pseudoalteromonas sp. S408]TMN98117.1 hypothetical protein CWB61_08650 [Pseudoalteromonas sp. S407]TMO00003.1 hypothetical protein CWB63_08560 [Pseudoalteromonas sp. S409]TMO11806.1 hypothetical protein CWB57_05650 [Pseudoalteromonas sp. S186]
MKKVALVISILAFVIICFLIKEQSKLDKLSAGNDSSKVAAKHLNTKETISIETSFEDNVFATPEEYLFEAKEIRRCNTIPKTQDELDDWLSKANGVDEPYEYIEDVLSRFERCSHSNLISDDFVEQLVKAIKLGSDNAVTELWAISDKEYFQSKGLFELSREETIEHRIKFNKLKFELSESIALNGGEQSILRLVKEYQNYDPDSGNPNYLRAIAYANFGLEIVEDNDIYVKLDFIKRRITQNMEFQDIEQAQVLTEQFLSKFGETGN